MSQETQIYIECYTGKPLEHEFNIIKTGDEFYLNTKEKKYQSHLIDTGDYLEWHDNDGQKNTFSYIDAEELLILFLAWNKTKIEFRQHVVLKSI
jgi:hypothetical protein